MAKDPKPQPTLKPTTPATLFVTALAAGALMLLVAARFYSYVPRPSWYTPVMLLVLAFALAFLAYTTKARIDRRPGTEPPEPLVVARYAALAKASSIGGSLFAGVYAGLVVYTVAQRTRLTVAAEDLPPSAFGFVACLMLVAAALWLERACRVPEDDDRDDDSSGNVKR
ncbi:DUF3180 domain-containing protein [Stackebrandtia soli]|uniref:DUF3180 domain-containing protein n=1 Tax=Stackebrandtia soli TaxID=1892856 RepID=UPI0039EC1CC0